MTVLVEKQQNYLVKLFSFILLTLFSLLISKFTYDSLLIMKSLSRTIMMNNCHFFSQNKDGWIRQMFYSNFYQLLSISETFGQKSHSTVQNRSNLSN